MWIKRWKERYKGKVENHLVDKEAQNIIDQELKKKNSNNQRMVVGSALQYDGIWLEVKESRSNCREIDSSDSAYYN